MLFKNGTLITASGPVAGHLEVRDQLIVGIHPAGSILPADQPEIDATDRWILPGGIDAHTHFGMPLGGGLASLGWRASSEAALLGGTTTIVDFANPERGEPLAQAVQRWRGMADPHILCDYGLHCTVVEAVPERLAEIPGLVAAGIPTFKGFLAYKDRLMLEPEAMKGLMRAVQAAGALLLVHAEDGHLNAAAQDVLLNTGRIGPRYHPLAHPEESELQAVRMVLDWARETGCPLEVVHISLAASLDLLTEARAAHPDLRLVSEVCLHHLFAQSGLYESGHEAALAAICSPPLRSQEKCEALQEALVRGEVDLLSTDHCEFPLQVKAERAAGGFHQVPNGCGGVGERLVISHTRLVATGRLDPAAWVKAIASEPARQMGLAGRKGALEVGCDADIVLFDPHASSRWEPLGSSDRAGSLWAGQQVTGRVCDVWLRGRQVVEGGRLVIDQPGGLFLPRHF